MRTIEEIVNELKKMAEPSTESHYNADVRYCQKLLDEILEISKANESVKGDLISRSLLLEHIKKLECHAENKKYEQGLNDCLQCYFPQIINNQPTACNDGWIPVSSGKLPPVETEVWIVAKRKWRDGTCKYITTTAMYEDGTVLENDSCWRWEDIDGEWNEEEDCMIIPEGWWENKHYNGDGELNHEVDDEVIYWQPLPSFPQPYKENENG